MGSFYIKTLVEKLEKYALGQRYIIWKQWRFFSIVDGFKI
jgi:hypothetical protein